MSTPARDTEIEEAVKLLHALCRPVAAIARQVGIPEQQVRSILRTGHTVVQQAPKQRQQMTLFK